jgi:hypothetical protein
VKEVATASVPSPPRIQRWGLGDALVGWVVVYLVSIIWGAVVITATGHAGEEFDDLPLGIVALAQLGLAAGFFIVPWAVTKVKGNGIVADLGLRARWADLWQGGLAGIATQVIVIPLLYWPLLEASTTSRVRPRPSPTEPTDRSTWCCWSSSSA